MIIIIYLALFKTHYSKYETCEKDQFHRAM